MMPLDVFEMLMMSLPREDSELSASFCHIQMWLERGGRGGGLQKEATDRRVEEEHVAQTARLATALLRAQH